MRAAAWLLAAAPWVASPIHGRWGVAYLPADAPEKRPPIVYLHGMWASPEDSCEPFARGAAPFGFLICPRGNAPFGTGTMWSGTAADAARSLHAAMQAVDAARPGRLGNSDGTLLGYSNGAYFAAELACAEPHRWTGLVLLSMKIDVDPARLRAAGVLRVVLGAGDRDASRGALMALEKHLTSGGVEARFMSLGPGGHELPSDLPERMCDAIAWARGASPSECAAR